MKEKLARGIYNTRNLSELENDYEVLLESYNRDSFGPNRNKVLCDSLKHLQVAMFQSLADSLGTEVSREVGAAERKIAELEIREKGFKMMNDTLENQIQMTRGDDEKFDREYKDLEDRNNEFIKTLSEANYAAQEYKYRLGLTIGRQSRTWKGRRRLKREI